MNNFETQYDFIQSGTHKAPVIEGRIVDGLSEITCPYCGRQHTHGKGDGHRLSHCSTGSAREIQLKDGTIVDENKGYYIKNKR